MKMTAKPMPAEKELLNRKIYKEVKKMDRQSMEAFLQHIYQSGAEDQLDHMKNVGTIPYNTNSTNSNKKQAETTRKTMEKIAGTLHKHLGIGDKRFLKVEAEIQKALEEVEQ